MALTPVQLWQLTHASSNTVLPATFAVAPPSFGDGGAGGAIVAGISDDIDRRHAAHISDQRVDVRPAPSG